MTSRRQVVYKVGCPSVGFFGLMTIVLTALKLMGYIDISWLWVVACFFVPWILVGVIGLSFLLFALVIGILAGAFKK